MSETKFKSQSISTQLRDWLKSYFDGVYSLLGHHHDSSYSALGHNHSGVYSPVSHNHSGVYSPTSHEHLTTQVIFMHGLGGTIPAGGTMYLVPAINGLTTMNGMVLPMSGTITNLYFKSNSLQPASGSLVATVQENFTNTTLVASVAAGSNAPLAMSANSHAFTGGRFICVAIKNNASAASAQITFCSVEYRTNTF